jgi:hypothetical protein
MMIMHKFMKSKGMTPQELHAMSIRAGSELPLDRLQAKFEFMEKKANGEDVKYDWKSGCANNGPMGYMKLFQQFISEKNVTAQEIHEMAKEAGHDMPIEKI